MQIQLGLYRSTQGITCSEECRTKGVANYLKDMAPMRLNGGP